MRVVKVTIDINIFNQLSMIMEMIHNEFDQQDKHMRASIVELNDNLNTSLNEFKTEIKSEINANSIQLNDNLNTSLNDFRTEIKSEMSEIN